MSQTGAVKLTEVRDWLEEGLKVALYVRHAERPPILPDDPTFGINLPLTEKGRKQALAFGRVLAGTADSVKLWSSPMLRTRLTVRTIAEGLGLGTGLPVKDAEEISVEQVFSDTHEVHRIMQEVGVFEYQVDYFSKGHAEAATPVAEVTDVMLGWIKKVSTADLNLFGSHDVTVGTVLAGLGLTTITIEDWVPFLTGLAMVHRDGQWHCHWLHDSSVLEV